MLHDLEAREIDRLPRQVRQRLLGIDLRAALGEDRLESRRALSYATPRRRLLLARRTLPSVPQRAPRCWAATRIHGEDCEWSAGHIAAQ